MTTETEQCACRCHVYPPGSIECDVDDGSSGVPGKNSCGYHAQDEIPIEGACVLPHAPRLERFKGLLCRRHFNNLDQVLDQVLELYALLPDVIQPGSGRDGRGSRQIYPPAPLKLGVAALTDARAKSPIDLEPGDIPNVLWTLESWQRVVEAESEHPFRAAVDDADGPLCRPLAIDIRLSRTAAERLTCEHESCRLIVGAPRPTVTEIIRYLKRERFWIAQQAWIDDYVTELDAIHRALATAVGDSMWPKPIGECPDCGRNLYNTIGLDEVTCRPCRRTWRGINLVRLRLILEQESA